MSLFNRLFCLIFTLINYQGAKAQVPDLVIDCRVIAWLDVEDSDTQHEVQTKEIPIKDYGSDGYSVTVPFELENNKIELNITKNTFTSHPEVDLSMSLFVLRKGEFGHHSPVANFFVAGEIENLTIQLPGVTPSMFFHTVCL